MRDRGLRTRGASESRRSPRVAALSGVVELTAYHQTLNLIGSFEDLGDFCLAHVPLNPLVAGVAVATEYLHGVGGDFHRGIRGNQLGDGRVPPVRHSGVAQPCGVEVGGPSRIDRGRHVRQRETETLVIDDLAPTAMRHSTPMRSPQTAGSAQAIWAMSTWRVAAPDARFGEVAAKVVALRPGVTLDIDSLASHFAASGLAKQKTPERIGFVDALPRTALGKVRKAELRHAHFG